MYAANTPDTTWFGGKEQHPRLCNSFFPCAREQSCFDAEIQLVSTAVASDPGESCILATFQKPASALRLCIRGAGASQMRQVHEIDGSEMRDGKRGRQMEGV
jgi:hypothetical protein